MTRETMDLTLAPPQKVVIKDLRNLVKRSKLCLILRSFGRETQGALTHRMRRETVSTVKFGSVGWLAAVDCQRI